MTLSPAELNEALRQIEVSFPGRDIQSLNQRAYNRNLVLAHAETRPHVQNTYLSNMVVAEQRLRSMGVQPVNIFGLGGSGEGSGESTEDTGLLPGKSGLVVVVLVVVAIVGILLFARGG